MNASIQISHESYVPASSVDGYPVPATYGSAVTRLVYGWQPETLSLGGANVMTDDEHGMRVTDRVEVLVPDVLPYTGLDRITLGALTYRIDEIHDLSNDPFGITVFGSAPGVVVVERVSG